MVNDRVLAKSPCFGCSKARWIEIYPDYNTIAIRVRVRVKVIVQLVSLLSNTHPLDIMIYPVHSAIQRLNNRGRLAILLSLSTAAPSRAPLSEEMAQNHKQTELCVSLKTVSIPPLR